MNGTTSTPTTPQQSSTSPHGAYDEAEHAEHLKGAYGLPGVDQEPATHFDFLNQPLRAGDKVVLGVGGRSGGLKGPYKILSFAPVMVRLTDEGDPIEHWRTAMPGKLVKVAA